jgi:long-subunit acyl-CoA synthetase (AMP-forming)
MAKNKLILDYVYDLEASQPDKVYLTQPLGQGKVADYTWKQTLDQSRRMAAYLKSRNFEPGARIAILSKNCAHFFMAELAIWMAGYTTVAIFPTETAETVNYVLEHSGASLLFVGKLDTWNQQEPGVPAGLPRIAFPLAPRTDYDTWDSIASRTEPMGGRPARAPDDTAMIIYTSGSTGQPKGVMHCFENITRASEGITADIKSRIGNLPENRIMSYLPLAHVFERAWVECASLIDGNTRVYFAETLDTFLADLNRARPTTFISVPSSVAEVPAGRVHQDAAQEAGPPAQHPHPGPHRRPQGAQGPGSGSGAAGRQRLGTDPGRPDRLVPPPGPEPDRRLCDDRGLRLLAQLDRGHQRARLRGACRWPASRCASVTKAKS